MWESHGERTTTTTTMGVVVDTVEGIWDVWQRQRIWHKAMAMAWTNARRGLRGRVEKKEREGEAKGKGEKRAEGDVCVCVWWDAGGGRPQKWNKQKWKRRLFLLGNHEQHEQREREERRWTKRGTKGWTLSIYLSIYLILSYLSH